MAVTSFRDITTLEVGQSGKEVVANAAWENLARGVSGYLSRSVAGSSDVTLTDTDENDEAKNGILNFTGLLTGNINVIVPTKARSYIVANNTTGAFTLTVKTSGGSGIAVTQSTRTILYCDGTNVLQISGTAGAFTTEDAQDAVGAMVDSTLVYVDATPLLTRAALTGDVTAAQASNSTTIANNAVTHAKYQDIATDRLLGRDTASSGDPEELTVGGGIEFTGSGGIQRSALTGDVTASAGSNSTTVLSASDTQAGKVELATIAETSTGTDSGRAVTPDGLAGSIFGTVIVTVPIGDPLGSQIMIGDGKAYFRVPSTLNGMNLVGVALAVSTASSSGLPTYQLRRMRGGSPADMLSTKVTVDANELDSSTATAAAVIDGSNDDVQTGDQIHFDKDVAGTGEKGDQVEMQFRLP